VVDAAMHLGPLSNGSLHVRPAAQAFAEAHCVEADRARNV
jgi:hypothetical protein